MNIKKSGIFLLAVLLVAGAAFGITRFFSSSATPSLAMISASFPSATSSIGLATTYGVLASTYTDTSGATTVNGDVGFTTGPATAIAGVHTNYGSGAPYSAAGSDEGSALTALASQPCTFSFASGAIDLSVDTTHGAVGVYAPGVYCSTGAMSVGSSITLSGNGTYIFRPVGALTTASNATVALTNGASQCNVFWTPTQATTLAANTTFAGTVIDDSGITSGANTTWVGRALSFGGTVTTNADTITVPTCVGAPVVQSQQPAGVPQLAPIVSSATVVPLIGITKVPTPLALPAGSGSVTYNYTVWNVGGQEALVNVTVTDNKCSTIDFLSGDINNNGKLDPGENWKYSCTATLSTTTTNTAVATGYSDDPSHQVTIATAIATVVVGSPLPAPLINITKVPSRLTTFPFGGGMVTYTYTVTNPGVVAMNNVSVTDNKCASASFVSGDANGNNLLDPGETWIYTCETDVPVTTSDIATALGSANGFTATAYAFATVLVSAPGLPNTGFPPKGDSVQ